MKIVVNPIASTFYIQIACNQLLSSTVCIHKSITIKLRCKIDAEIKEYQI